MRGGCFGSHGVAADVGGNNYYPCACFDGQRLRVLQKCYGDGDGDEHSVGKCKYQQCHVIPRRVFLQGLLTSLVPPPP